MNELLTLLPYDLHPILIHFPLALLTVSVGFDLLSPLKPDWRPAGWITLLLGTIGAFGASATGNIATWPFEGTPLEALIELHQIFAIATTLFFIGLTVWRGLSLRRGGGHCRFQAVHDSINFGCDSPCRYRADRRQPGL